MSPYEKGCLVVGFFTALGTCGATISALYFWLNEKKLKLNILSMHADIYGNLPTVDGGFFTLRLTNKSYFPITVDAVGLKCYHRKFFFKKMVGYLLFENTSPDSLPKKIEFSTSYYYAEPMNSMHEKFKLFKSELKLEVSDLKICVLLPTENNDIHFDLDYKLKNMLLKSTNNP